MSCLACQPPTPSGLSATVPSAINPRKKPILSPTKDLVAVLPCHTRQAENSAAMRRSVAR